MQKRVIRKRILEMVFFVTVFILSIYTVTKGQDITLIWKEIQSVSGVYLVTAMCMALCYIASEGVMIHFLLRPFNAKCKLTQCLGYSFIGFFYSAITPSASGGQPMQLIHMKKNGEQLNTSLVVLMTIALLNKIVLCCIGIALFAKPGLADKLNEYYPLFLIGLALDFIWVFILIAIMIFPTQIKNLLMFFVRIFYRRKQERAKSVGAKLDGFFEGYHESLSYILKNPVRVVIVTVITFIQRMFPVMITFLVYKGLRMTGTGMLDIITRHAAILVTVEMLPIPGGQGITELIYKNIFADIFTGVNLASSVYVTRGINFYFILLVSGAVVLVKYLKDRRKDEIV